MNFRKTIVYPFLALLDTSDVRKGRWIIFLMILNALLDFFSLAAFLPLLFMVVSPSFIKSNTAISNLYHNFHFSSTAAFSISFALAVLVFIIIKNILSAWITKVRAQFAFDIGSGLSSRAMRKYLDMNYFNFTQIDYTQELNRITNYPFAFANNMVIPMATLISEGFVSLLILIGVSYYNYNVMLLLLLVLIPTTLLYLVRRKKLQGISNDIKQKYPQLLKFALQSIEGFIEIKATEKEDFFHHRFNKMNKSITQTFIRDQLIQSVSIRLTEIIVGTILCFLVGYTVYIREDYQQTLLLLGVYTGAGFRILPSVNRILHASQQIQMHEHLLSELGPLKNYQPTFSKASPAASFREMLQLKEVTYGYPGGPLILDRLSINIKKGEKIVVTGNSGEGKTTFLLILLRFLKETQGRITVDNNPIMDEVGWRKQIGYVSQNPYVLDATIAENIAFGIPSREIDRNKVKKLLDELGLAEVIRRLPDGIDTLIGERGITLSGGQRQRLAIARVLYAEVNVLLLDEITNQVHASMEEEILTALTAVGRREKTIVMIAHKLTHNDFFDSIYRLENGKLR